MKKIYSHLRFFITKSNIFATLCALIISDLTFAQLSAEDSLFQEANYYLDAGYYESAINSLEKLLELNPNSAEAYGLLGSVYNLQGDFDEAIQMYHKCIGLDSSAIPIITNLGNAFIDAGEPDSAIAVHKYLISKEDSNPDHYVDLGDAYIKKEDITQAELYFKKAIQLNPYYCLAHVNLGIVYANQKKYTEAIDELFLVRNLDGWYPGLQDQMYQIIMNSDSEFEDWVEREPDNSEAHYYYSFYLYYDHDRDDAVDELDEAIKLNSKEEKYYLARATWLWNLGEYEESIADCKKCLEINPDNWKCHNRIGSNYSSTEDDAKALEHYKKSVEIDSLVIESQFHLGEVYYIDKKYQQSIDALNKAVRLGHKTPFAYYVLAFDYYHLEDFESAMQNAMIAKNKNSVQKKLNEIDEENLDWLLNELQQKMNQK